MKFKPGDRVRLIKPPSYVFGIVYTVDRIVSTLNPNTLYELNSDIHSFIAYDYEMIHAKKYEFDKQLKEIE